MNLKIVVCIVSVLVLFSSLTAQQSTGPKSYKVIIQNDGYVLQLGPKLKNFPSGATLEITLDDPAQGKTTIRGTATKLSDNSFKIKTSQKFSFQPSSGTHVLMRRMTGLRTKVTKPGLGVGGEPPCGTCRGMAGFDCMDPPDCTMCFCWAEPAAAQANPPSGTTVAWRCGSEQDVIRRRSKEKN